MNSHVKNAVTRLLAANLSPQIDHQKVTASLNAEHPDPVQFIGQKRALSALNFGLKIDAPGYNLYVMGEPALGRHSLVNELLKQVAAGGETPDEWCYINNFEDSRVPSVIRLKPGESKTFSDDIESLIDELLDTFPAAFDNPGYQRHKKNIDRKFNLKYDQALADVEHEALEKGVALYEENNTVSFAPVINGKAIEDADFANLNDEQRQHFYDVIQELEVFLNEKLLELPKWKRETSEQQRELKKSTIEQAIKPLIKELEHKYASELGILKYLRDIRDELVTHVSDWLSDETDSENKDDIDHRALFVDLIMPNPLVQYGSADGAPVIYEPNPTFQNLFGRIEYSSLQSAIFTNYRMIQPGALHKANGGYLLIEAEKMLGFPNVWETLKRAINQREIGIEMPQLETTSLTSVSMNPQIVPLDVKIILLGSRELYYTMQEYDDEFNELFRVLADFEYSIPWSERTQHQFIRKVLEKVESLDVDGINDAAIVRLLEFSFRQAEHQEKLSARFADVIELLHEAVYYCHEDDETVIDSVQIDEALEARQYRSGRISESFLADIKEGQILIDTQGESIGKVNGLTVLEIGDTVFGTPARISATVYAGANGVVDIEREADLGKAIHSKGVMLLNGYLGHKYAQDFCLTLSANIAIEQSYGHIDGDSASLGELCALISAIANVPMSQSLAITGSINQHGQVQSVGGVNEKIEGFFNLCKARGLTGEQGVIIPATNCINLVLSKEVIAAVEAERFTIFAVNTVDEALELLSGQKAGTLSSRGAYQKNSVNYRAVQRLKAIADVVNGSGED